MSKAYLLVLSVNYFCPLTVCAIRASCHSCANPIPAAMHTACCLSISQQSVSQSVSQSACLSRSLCFVLRSQFSLICSAFCFLMFEEDVVFIFAFVCVSSARSGAPAWSESVSAEGQGRARDCSECVDRGRHHHQWRYQCLGHVPHR